MVFVSSGSQKVASMVSVVELGDEVTAPLWTWQLKSPPLAVYIARSASSTLLPPGATQSGSSAPPTGERANFPFSIRKTVLDMVCYSLSGSGEDGFGTEGDDVDHD